MAKIAILPLINLTLNPAEATAIRDALMEVSNKNPTAFSRIDESIELLDQALNAFTPPEDVADRKDAGINESASDS